ncbi:MAG: hypothetical protein WDA13_01315 [Candidatus Shapirobacteria bacterium]
MENKEGIGKMEKIVRGVVRTTFVGIVGSLVDNPSSVADEVCNRTKFFFVDIKRRIINGNNKENKNKSDEE